MQQPRFLNKLAEEAQLQAQLQASAVVPKRLEFLASVIGAHTWKVLLILSGLLAGLVEVSKL